MSDTPKKSKKQAEKTAEKTEKGGKSGDGARAMMANKLYTRQLPDVLPEDYNSAETIRDHHGTDKCYDCCTEKGCCSPMCTLIIVGSTAACCLCCCYVTNGFGGVWTYWPN